MTGRERELTEAARRGPTTTLWTVPRCRREVVRELEELFAVHERVLASWPDHRVPFGYRDMCVLGESVTVTESTRIAVLRVPNANTAWEIRDLLGDAKRFFTTETSSISGAGNV